MSTHTYTLGIIGCGAVARKHLKAIQLLNRRVRLIGVADPAEDRARAVLSTFPKMRRVPVYPDLGALLSAGRPDIIAITTPSGTHYSLAKAAISDRVHVLIEKPMALDLGEARELLELAEDHHVTIAMGHIYRYFPLMQLLHGDISAGRLGKVYSGDVKVRWGHGQTYYDQSAWRGTWSQDGGALMNQTIHACDLMCWLMDDEPVQVSGTIRQFAHKMEADDHGAALLSLSTGAVCMIEGTTCSLESRRSARFHLIAEDAEIEAGILNGRPYFRMHDRSGRSMKFKYYRRFWRSLREAGGLGAIRWLAHPHTGLYADFIRSLDNGTQPSAGGDSGVQSVETMLAVYKSALSGGEPVSLPLDDFALTDMKGYFEGATPDWERR